MGLLKARGRETYFQPIPNEFGAVLPREKFRSLERVFSDKNERKRRPKFKKRELGSPKARDC